MRPTTTACPAWMALLGLGSLAAAVRIHFSSVGVRTVPMESDYYIRFIDLIMPY